MYKNMPDCDFCGATNVGILYLMVKGWNLCHECFKDIGSYSKLEGMQITETMTLDEAREKFGYSPNGGVTK